MSRAPLALVDVGSNSVALVVARPLPSGWQIIEQQKTTLQLGAQRDGTGALRAEASAALLDLVAAYQQTAASHGAAVSLVATASLRGASNASGIIRQLNEIPGVSGEILPAEEEALYAFRGVWAGDGFSEEPMVVVDVGGGSIEVAWGQGGAVQRSCCWSIGVVGLTATHGRGDPWPDDIVERLDHSIMEQLGDSKTAPNTTVAASGAGSIRRLARLAGASIDQPGLRALVERLGQCRHRAERMALPGVDPARADILLASALIHLRLAERFGWRGYRLSQGGIRRGLLDRALARMA